MREKLLYFDNAATTYPKPPAISRAMTDCMSHSGGNPGRGSHPLAVRASDLLHTCREEAADFFDAEVENVAFTYNATYALNFALKGLLAPGDHVLISGMSHNAVYRPIAALARDGKISFDVYPHSPGDTDGKILQSIEAKIRPNTKMVVATHASNICSEREPIGEIGALCRRRGLFFVVDAAQSAGRLPVSVREMGITALCVPGHKGLYGPQGCGMLINGGDVFYNTIIEGGSGSQSLDAAMPEVLPDRMEAGTHGTPAIAGLLAGMRWVNREGIGAIFEHEAALSSYLWSELSSDPFFTVYGSGDGGVISFTAREIPPASAAKFLADRGICSRSGYHCAPLAHRSVGSLDTGSVRVSFSHFNTKKEVLRLLDTLYILKKKYALS